MNEQNDILKDLKATPFRMPEGYLENLETDLQKKINPENGAAKGWRTVLKPVFYLAAMFGLIFGMAYGIMNLTDSRKIESSSLEESIAEIEFGFIKSSFIDHYNEEESDFSELSSLGVEEIESYLSDALSFNQVVNYLEEE